MTIQEPTSETPHPGRFARVVEIVTFQESEDSLLRYWRDQSPATRIAAVDMLRRRMYAFGGNSGSFPRLERVARVISR